MKKRHRKKIRRLASKAAAVMIKAATEAVLNEAIKSCEYWAASVQKEMNESGDSKMYGKINILGLVKMDLQHLKKHGYRYFPVSGEAGGDPRPRDKSFWG